MKIPIVLIPLLILLTACGNPGNISDAFYQEYKELGAPKILYSCTEGYPDAQAMIDCRTSDRNAEAACIKKLVGNGKDPRVNVGTIAGVGINATYNKILGESKAACGGDFKVLESKG